MGNDSVVEKIVKSLSFEVEAVPQDNVLQLTPTTKAAPLNVKIRVRKKEEAAFRNGVMSLPNRPDGAPERVRLVSSDQTIMSFSVIMEADFQKPVKKPRRNIFGLFKPTSCLGAQSSEDDDAYSSINSYKAEINDENTSNSETALTEFTLSKNIDNGTSVTKRNTDFFGKCKPGGCLDPPFGEDRLPYSPVTVDKQATVSENVAKGKRVAEPPAVISGPPVESKRKTSSIISNKMFHKKRKSSNSEILDNNVIKKGCKTEPVVDLYQAGSQKPSDIILTYPPMSNSNEEQEEKRGSRIYNDPSKNSVSEHSGSYFIIPKKPKSVLDRNNNVKKENDSDIRDSKAEAINIKSGEKNVVAQPQVLEGDQNKHSLGSIDSVTDVKERDRYLSEPFDVDIQNAQKPIKSLVPNNVFIPIPIPLNTKHEQVEMENKPTAADERCKEPEEEKGIRKSIPVTNNVIKNHKSSDANFNQLLLIDDTLTSEVQKSTPKNRLGSDTSNDNILQSQITHENEPRDKSSVTHDTEESILFLTGDSTTKNKRKSSSKGIEDQGFTKIPTIPIIRDKLFDPIQSNSDDLQQTRKNTDDAIISDMKLKTDELNKQINQSIDTLHEVSGIEFYQPSSISFSKLNDSKRQDENIVAKHLDTQTETNIPPEIVMPKTEVTHSKNKKTDSIVSQNLQDTAAIIPLIPKLEVNRDSKDFQQLEKTSDYTIEQTQTRVFSSDAFTDSGQKAISHNDDLQSQKSLIFEENKAISKNLPEYDHKTELFDKEKDSTVSENGSKTNDKEDTLNNSNEGNTESKENYKKQSVNDTLNDLTEDMIGIKNSDDEITQQDLQSPIPSDKTDFIKDDANGLFSEITEDQNKSSLDDRAISEENPLNYVNENNIGTRRDSKLTSEQDPLSNVTENKTGLRRDSEQTSEHDPSSNVTEDNTGLRRDSEQTSEQDLLSNVTENKKEPRRDSEQTREQDPSSNVTEDKTWFRRDSEETSEQDPLSNVTENKKESSINSEQTGHQDPLSDFTEDKTGPRRDSDQTIQQDPLSNVTEDKTGPRRDSKRTSEQDPSRNVNEDKKSPRRYSERISEQDPLSYVTEDKKRPRLGNELTSEEDLLDYFIKDKKEPKKNGERTSEQEPITYVAEDKKEPKRESEQTVGQDPLNYDTENKKKPRRDSEQTSSMQGPLLYITEDKIGLSTDNQRISAQGPLNYESENEIRSRRDNERTSEQTPLNYVTEDKIGPKGLNDQTGEHDSSNYITEVKTEFENSDEVTSERGPLNYFPERIIDPNDDEANNKYEHHYITHDNILKDLYDNKNKKESPDAPDAIEKTVQGTDKKKVNDKHDKKFRFDDENTTVGKITKAASEITGFEQGLSDKFSSSQPCKTTSKNKARPILVNFAIQSYTDNNGLINVKSFDGDNEPKRYPNDFMRVSKRYLDYDDEIKIPIDLENDLHIQIKSNKQRDQTDEVKPSTIDTGITKKSVVSNKHDESDQIKRNVVIAEELRKTLEAVYEKELLPLRSTVTELKDNIEMLTTHNMQQGHMFVEKFKSSKVIPLFKKCSCTKK